MCNDDPAVGKNTNDDDSPEALQSAAPNGTDTAYAQLLVSRQRPVCLLFVDQVTYQR